MQLIAQQRDDGGWGWLSGDPSDALATGMALYAINKVRDDSTITAASRAAADFLVTSQKEDGSWDVPGTKKSTRKKSTPTSNYWGTAWAVIGILEAGPRS